MNKEAYPEHRKLTRPHTFLRLVCAAALVGLLAVGYEKASMAHDPHKFFVVDDSEALQGLQEKHGEKITENLSVVWNLIPPQETLETRIAGDLKLTKLWGNWSDQQMSILVMGDKFTDNTEFLQTAAAAVKQIFFVEPYASQKDKFGAYALSVDSTLSLSCLKPFVLCNDNIVTDIVDRVTYAYRLHVTEPIVILNSLAAFDKAYIKDPENPKDTNWSYLLLTKGATDPGRSSLNIAAHGFSHSFGGLWDEYDFPFPFQSASGEYINCVPDPDKSWAHIPNHPGKSFPGCHNTNNGYRDHEGDLMRLESNILGLVDKHIIQERINLGLNGYYLPPLPDLPHRQYLPIISNNKPASSI